MNRKYNVKVNNLYDFDFDTKEIEENNVVETTKNNFHFLKDNQSFTAKIIHSDFNRKTYTIQVNGNPYEVKIADELDMLITELGMEASAVKKENDIKAPMPGLIISIDVKEGQSVAEGEGILVLEAMKMENTLSAPRDGVIKSIVIKEGEKVEKNTVLIEME